MSARPPTPSPGGHVGEGDGLLSGVQSTTAFKLGGSPGGSSVAIFVLIHRSTAKNEPKHEAPVASVIPRLTGARWNGGGCEVSSQRPWCLGWDRRPEFSRCGPRSHPQTGSWW